MRAYSDSLKAAIALAEFSNIRNAYEVSFDLNYDDYGKVEKLIQNYNNSENNIYSLDKTFEDVVKLRYLVSQDIFDSFKNEIVNMTRGKTTLDEKISRTYYTKAKEVIYI